MISVALPIQTVNELNDHRHWRTRQRRAQTQRFAVSAEVRRQAWVSKLLVRRIGGVVTTLKPGVKLDVVLVRVAPSRGLDPHDGLPASLKHVADGVADGLGVDDRDPRLAWRYEQRRGPYGVEVRLQTVTS